MQMRRVRIVEWQRRTEREKEGEKGGRERNESKAKRRQESRSRISAHLEAAIIEIYGGQ